MNVLRNLLLTDPEGLKIGSIGRLSFAWWRRSSVELTKRCVISFIHSVSLIRKVHCYQTSNCPAWAWRRRTPGPYNTASPSHTPAPDYRKSAHPLRPRLAETFLPRDFPSTRSMIPLSNNFPHVKQLVQVVIYSLWGNNREGNRVIWFCMEIINLMKRNGE